MGFEFGKGRYTRFDAVAEFRCPKCGETKQYRLWPWDVYWEKEGGLDVKCHACGAEYTAMDLDCPDDLADGLPRGPEEIS